MGRQVRRHGDRARHEPLLQEVCAEPVSAMCRGGVAFAPQGRGEAVPEAPPDGSRCRVVGDLPPGTCRSSGALTERAKVGC